ncbi:hypothetical protein LguiB_016527 [Lonicera macranthoides]
MENAFKRNMPWLDELGMKDPSSSILPGLSLVQWMSMQQHHHNNNNRFPTSHFSPIVSSNPLQNSLTTDDPSKLLNFQSPPISTPTLHQSIKPNQNPQYHQQLQLQQLLHSSINPQQQQTQNQNSQFQQQHQQNQHQNSQQPVVYSQSQQQQPLTGNIQSQQNVPSANRNSFPLTSLPQDSQFQPQIEQQQTSHLQRPQQQQTQFQQAQIQLLQQSLLQRSQIQNSSQQSLSEQQQQQLQLQLLQKLQQQQQQQQLLSPVSPRIDPQQQQGIQHNRQSQQSPLSQQQVSNNSFSTSPFLQSTQFPMNQLVGPQKPLMGIRAHAHSGVTEGDAPSCSTSPSTNNCQVAPSKFANKYQEVPPPLMDDSVANPPTNMIHQELPNKSDIRIKHELPTSKGLEKPKYKGIATDQLEASSSATSYCMEANGLPNNFSLPGFCLDGDIQSQTRNNLPFAANSDGLTPDALLSRGFDSQNLLPNYGGTPRDIETELSTAALSSQSFGLPDLSFKPVVSNDVAINEAGPLCNGLWGNQTQRMRTYTKVQKRGSVGRTIDVTRYKGYGELRHDLARLFGIEGQLEDSRAPEWKLVYVDHENDILLVGDDPWEEFVSCVQSIKILSSAEVQQMSLDGDLAQVPLPPNQACSGTDSGNAWKGQYDDNSAASFNR